MDREREGQTDRGMDRQMEGGMDRERKRGRLCTLEFDAYT